MITEAPSKITHMPVTHVFVRNRMIWQFYILAGLCSFVASSLGPMMPFLRGELKFDYTIMAYHFSAFALGVLISGAVGERVMTYLGRKKAMWAGLAGVAAGVGILILGKAPAPTIFGIFLAGMCASIFGQVIDTVIAERLGENRTIAITETNIVTSICATVAPAAIGSFVAAGFDWRTPLAILILCLGISYAVFGRNNVPVPLNTERNSVQESSRLTRAYWAYWLVILLGCASEWSIVFWSPDFLQNAVKMERTLAATAVSAFSIAMMAGRITGSVLSRRLSIRLLLPAAAVLSLFGFSTFWLAPTAVINVLGLFIAGLGVANMYPLTLSAALGAAPKNLALAASRMNMATGAAGLCAPLILGGIADRAGIFQAYSAVAIMLTLAVAAIFYANKLATSTENSR
ncbi:MAG: MFS transporter [Candidatus Obscuribacterales bacterium]|nr:MAG: MFS transporter [Candidatus Melainabacteria bacterium]